MPKSPFDATAADLTTLLVSLIAGFLLLAPLELWLPAHRTPHAQGARFLNIVYRFLTPLVTKAATNWVLIGCLALILFMLGRPLDESALNGFGPLSYQPLWLQTLEILIADFMDDWTQRFFHTSSVWRFRAVHHGSETMIWLAAAHMSEPTRLTPPPTNAVGFRAFPTTLLTGRLGQAVLIAGDKTLGTHRRQSPPKVAATFARLVGNPYPLRNGRVYRQLPSAALETPRLNAHVSTPGMGQS